jgi:hypothetical protein
VFRERQVEAYIIAPAPGIEQDIQKLIDNGIQWYSLIGFILIWIPM